MWPFNFIMSDPLLLVLKTICIIGWIRWWFVSERIKFLVHDYHFDQNNFCMRWLIRKKHNNHIKERSRALKWIRVLNQIHVHFGDSSLTRNSSPIQTLNAHPFHAPILPTPPVCQQLPYEWHQVITFSGEVKRIQIDWYTPTLFPCLTRLRCCVH